ncbi:hypothetical protein [Polaromonas sp.]|uniref:hypothetical protein n=1 Tax=Polaromonas sp. TaxID=1869339 RepID=UPI003C96809B
MQYTLSLTTRMMTIAGLCLLLLCVLLFLLGVEIGKKISSPAEGTAPAAALTATPPSSAPVGEAPSPPVAKP